MNATAVQSAARAARRRALKHADPLVAELVRSLAKFDFPTEQQDELWAWAGLAMAMSETLADAQGRSGRAIQERVFALHRLIRDLAGVESAAIAPLADYAGWLVARAQADPEARRVWMAWVDLFAERLTMHRYGAPGHRAGQARALIAEPLRLVACEGGGSQFDPARWQAIAEELLCLWDLAHAEAQGRCGWNRIEMPPAEQMGGFYGLGDEARPPTGEAIRAAAAELLAKLQVVATGPAQPARSPWDRLADAITRIMTDYLRRFLETGRWPAPPRRIWPFR